MRIADLPNDIDTLKTLVAERMAERDAAKAGLVAKTLEAEKLRFELARLKRGAFGQSSERIDRQIEQLELRLEEIEAAAADAPAALDSEPTPEAAEVPGRKPRRRLPDHLPRVTQTHEPASCACPRCGTERLRKVGCDVSEVLTYIPARFEVIRHVRPKEALIYTGFGL